MNADPIFYTYPWSSGWVNVYPGNSTGWTHPTREGAAAWHSAGKPSYRIHVLVKAKGQHMLECPTVTPRHQPVEHGPQFAD